MNDLLNIPLHIQEQRAKEANMSLLEWQIMIIKKVSVMREAAIVAEQNGKLLLENGTITQEAVERMLCKMQSAFPKRGENNELSHIS